MQPFGNASSTSEEDEIIKKEREIIEILEKEEQWRYGTNTVLSPSDHHLVGMLILLMLSSCHLFDFYQISFTALKLLILTLLQVKNLLLN